LISHVIADGAVLSFRRSTDDGAAFAIVANTGHSPVSMTLMAREIVLSTTGDRVGEQVGAALTLRSDEALILRL
jgi:hypothetical protein